MRKLAALVLVLVVAGCGSKSEKLPVACTEGYGAVLKALAHAPGTVVIDGLTPISRCFNRNASGDDIQIVGTNLLTAAQQLGDRARTGDTRAAVELGYLIGASERGTERNGLGGEMVRRIEAETVGLDRVRSPLARGRRAGSARG